MILRCVCWSIFLCLALGPTVNAQVTVDDQGYQNVLISFAPNVPSEKGKELVQSVQNLLESTSSVLHTAIGIRIASATFLLPPSWPTEEWKDITITPASSEQTARRPDIRVDDTKESPFGKQPVALQHGGCGVAGHQIALPLDFIEGAWKYPKEKLLAREWLKYRYGVFEENGFKGDKLYPNYYRISGKTEIRITECTDSNVTYTFKFPSVEGVCDVDQAGNFGYCITHPDEKSVANVTSSLMYYHNEIPKMEHICGKDGRPHHSTARNKQNALCNGRSIWEVVKSSDDFKKISQKSANPDSKPIQFSYIQESKPRLVVLLENSDNLHEKSNPILFALRRLYYDLTPKSKLAIYTYNSDVKDTLPYTELSDGKRSDLGVLADFGSSPTSVCTSCSLAKAAQILLQKSEIEKGSILLITASPLDKVPELPGKLKESGICLRVLRFTDKENPADQTYDVLAGSFHCFSHMSLQKNLGDAITFNGLNSFLKNDVHEYYDGEVEIKAVASGEMSAQVPVSIPRDPTASLYTLWLGRALGGSSIECKAGDTVVTLKPDTTATDIASFTFDPMEGEVTCKLGSTKQDPILAEVQMTSQKGQYFIVDTWIHDKSTEKDQLPIIIYAKIYFGGYPVKDANATMVVTSGERQEIVTMLDNGHGDPDVTRYDGIYSGYFAGFLEKGDYKITVKIDDNGKFAKIGKEYEYLVSDTCCGSEIVSKDYDAPAFKVEKTLVYTAKNKRPKDGYPPSRILDLQVPILPLPKKVVLTWMAPGGGKAASYVIKLFENRDDAITKFETAGMELNVSSKVPGDPGRKESFVISFEDLDEDVTYYAAVRSLNEFGKKSEISNVAEFFSGQEKKSTVDQSSTSTTPPSTTGETTKHDPPKNTNKTIGIVFGVLGGIAVVCILGYLGYYFLVKKPRQN